MNTVDDRRMALLQSVPQVTVVLMAGMAAVATLCAVTGVAIPGTGRNESLSLVSFLPDGWATGAIALLAWIGCFSVIVIMVGIARAGARPARERRTTIAVATVIAVLILTTIPGTSFLGYLGYLPMLLVGSFFDKDMLHALLTFDYFSLLVQCAAMLGGFGLAATTVMFARSTSSRCIRCGRAAHPSAGKRSGRLRGWGTMATIVAIVVPLIYAATRYGWLLGSPVGIDPAAFAESTEGPWLGAGLATCATAGAVLTVGLLRPWGERFPRWMLGVAGRRVPILLAVIPATIMSVVVTGAGLGMIAQLTIGDGIGGYSDLLVNWAAFMPTLLWPVWGVALAVATLAYALRRRGPCPQCGRGQRA